MSMQACAGLVERADPDRFRAVMAARPEARSGLFALHALNVEVSRAPWVTQEAMIAEMRLQWWRDALEEIAQGQAPRAHEVVDVLASVLTTQDAALLDGLVAARRWDIYTDSFEDADHLAEYIDATTGHLFWVAARGLGQASETVVRDFAFATGVANWLAAAAELEARGRRPLLDGTTEGIKALALEAQARLDRARRGRQKVSPEAGQALIAGFQTPVMLRKAIRDPGCVAAGALGLSPARKSWRLGRVALQGWWV